MNIEDYKDSKELWKYIEEKTIEMVSKQTNFSEPQAKLILEQSKQNNALGFFLKTVRQKKRISVKKMAERLNLKEEDIKTIESGDIVNFPLGLILSYLNNVGCVLTYRVIDSYMKKLK